MSDIEDTKIKEPKIKIAASSFETEVEIGAVTHSRTDARVRDVAGELKTTVMLFEDRGQQVCLIASDFGTTNRNTDLLLRTEAAAILGIDTSMVLVFSSHNHCGSSLLNDDVTHYNYHISDKELPIIELSPTGESFLVSLRKHLNKLKNKLEPVEVYWTKGEESRITYNRKGRRTDGSTYFMREEDRRLVGKDFNGDIDREVPVVVFRGQSGKPIAAILQYTGHPVTSYHPEKPVIFGEYPAVAADILAEALSEDGVPVPVAFLQGCCGDVNSKEMFTGGVALAQKFGEMLGQSAVAALVNLASSKIKGMDYVIKNATIPLAPLPDRETIVSEIIEMNDFIKRTGKGDEDTLSCVGLNFTHLLSPEYRGALIDDPLAWNKWALGLYEQGLEKTVMQSLEVPVYVLRIGDAAIIGIPFEPFQGIGRQIRKNSPFPLTIPCGYVNGSHGYLTDSANTGDREYMSSFYRYTRFRPPYAKPAGDVLADCAVEVLRNFTVKYKNV